jgi:hypothetical protein
MSPTSCRCSTPRRVLARSPRLGALGDALWVVLTRSPAGRLASRPAGPADGGWGVSAAASPPVGSPPQYSPALRWVTTGFGMGPGGASTLSATGTPHPQHAGGRRPWCAPRPGPEPPRRGGCSVREPSRSWGVAHAPCIATSRPLPRPSRPRRCASAATRGGEATSRWRGPPRCRATTRDGARFRGSALDH